MIKNLPVTQETQVWSLGWEDYLDRGMVTHSSILAWRIPWTEEPGGLQLGPRVLFPRSQSPSASQAALAHFEVETSLWIHFPK